MPAEALAEVTIVPYFSSILLAIVAGLLNPLGMQLLWQSAELSLRTFWILLRELSSRRRRLPIVLEELSSHSAHTAAPTAFWVSARRITEIRRQQTGTTPKTEPSIFRTLRPIQRTPTR